MSRRIGILAAVTFPVACQGPKDPDVIHGESLTVVNRTGGVLCRGTPDLLEREFRRISETQGLSIPPSLPITVELGAEAVADRCALSSESGVIAGCTSAANGEVGVATELVAASHELVHASRHAAGISRNAFFEEGVAEALRGGELTSYAIADDATADPLSPPDLVESFELAVASYITAGHFLSWLRRDRGDSLVFSALSNQAYSSSAGDVDIWFADAFSESLQDATQRWRLESDFAYWQPGPCSAAREIGAGLVLDGELDCGSSLTLGVLGGAEVEGTAMFSLPVCVDVTALDAVDVSVQAAEEVGVALSSVDDQGALLGTVRVQGGASQTVDLPARWLLVSVRTSLEDFQPYVVQIAPAM